MALLDPHVKTLPDANKPIGICFTSSAIDALLIAGQAGGLALVLSHLWEGKTLSDQVPFIILFFCCYLLRQAVDFGRNSYVDAYSRKTTQKLRQQMALSLYEQGIESVQSKGSGAVITTLIEGIDQTQNYLALILPKVTDLMVIPAILSLFLLFIDPMSGIICLVILPCIIFYMNLLGSYAKENAAKQHDKFQQMSNSFSDSLRGLATLKSFGVSKTYAERMYKTSERFRNATVKTLKSATLSSLVLDLFRVFALAAAAIMLGFRLLGGWVELFPALAVLIVIPEFFAAVRRYSQDFHASLDGRNQLTSILDTIAGNSLSEDTPYPFSEQAPELEIEHVNFSYKDKEGTHRALKNISFTARGPMKIGIIGASGSGKSTLARMLAGFSTPQSGTFTVDGVSGPSLCSDSWRRRATFIPQNPHVFHGTLKENVTFYCPHATDDQITQAIASAGLNQLVEALPNGLDTLIGEGGRRLSGGQAQRIALARAFLDTSRSVLILDEPTAHLDIETEFDLKKAMLPIMEGKMVFFSTHRLHWMQDMDLILVLDQGNIVEAGTLEQLQSNNSGAFARLTAQMRGDNQG